MYLFTHSINESINGFDVSDVWVCQALWKGLRIDVGKTIPSHKEIMTILGGLPAKRLGMWIRMVYEEIPKVLKSWI